MLHAGCGVEIDSPEERAVRNWAEGFDEKSYVARRVEEKMRELLREAELMAPARKVVRDDVDGTPWSRLMDAVLMGGGK